MLSLLWPKRHNDLKLEAQDAILTSGLEELKAVGAAIAELGSSSGKANGKHHPGQCASAEAWQRCPFGGLKDGEGQSS